MLESINRFHLYRIFSADQQVKLIAKATTREPKIVNELKLKPNEECFTFEWDHEFHEACRKIFAGIQAEAQITCVV